MSVDVNDTFTKEEAEALIGKNFKATAGYANVPPGTIGTVVDTYGAPYAGYGVNVEWDRPEDREARESAIRSVSRIVAEVPGRHGGRGLVKHVRIVKPLRDGFSKYELLGVFEGGEHKGKRFMEPVNE